MTLPRQVIPGEFLFITRRCTQQMHLLQPDEVTRDTYLYCLALAAERYEVDILLPCVMSNHHHLVVFDRHGRYPEFTEYLHKLVARSQNALLGRRENFWSSHQPSVVRLGEREDVMRKLVYTAVNPVKANLVDRAHHWPGVNGFSALTNQRELRIARPAHFFRKEGGLKKWVTLRFVIPAELGETEAVLAELRERVASEEQSLAEKRRLAGKSVLGRKRILAQRRTAWPTTKAPSPGLKPRIAVVNPFARVEALNRDRAFIAAYREARLAWKEGATRAFPPGTYWLRRFASVPIAAA